MKKRFDFTSFKSTKVNNLKRMLDRWIDSQYPSWTVALKVSTILDFIHQKAPPESAQDWDNVGLLLGDPNQETKGAVISIDLTDEAILLAQEKGFSLIITHHPCIFPKDKAYSSMLEETKSFQAIRNGISVIACHTNFDQCALEVGEMVAKGLGIKPVGRFFESAENHLLKLVTFIPLDYLEKVRSALFAAGAGTIGDYDQCSFASLGEGSFCGNQASKPFIGKPGVLEFTKEQRLEVLIPRVWKKKILLALFESHPYQEVAYDLFEVKQSIRSDLFLSGVGYGVFGEFNKEQSFSDVIKSVTCLFQISGFLQSGKAPKSIRSIGFVAGKGSAFIETVNAKKCDLFISGEVGYHKALKASQQNLCCLEIGHRESEKFFLDILKNWMSEIQVETTEFRESFQKFETGEFL